VGVCRQIVAAGQACHELLESNRLKRGALQRLPEPSKEEWRRLYRDHRAMRTGLLEAIGAESGWITEWGYILTFLSWCSNAEPDIVRGQISEDLNGVTFREFGKAIHEGERKLAADAKSVEELFESCDPERALSHPAFVFFVQAAMPLYLRHGEWPWKMLWRATRANNPDFRALDWLIRTDRRVRHHPLIEIARREAEPHLAKEFDRIIDLAASRKPRKVSVETVKTRLGGLMSQFALLFGLQLNTPEIVELFELQAKSEKGGKSGFPVGLWAQSKQMQRGKKHWLRSLPPAGTFESLKSVRALWERAFYHFGHEDARFGTT
jgi:hypothetical protein